MAKSGPKEKFNRTKPHDNIDKIRHVDHSKTTLTAAITNRMALETIGPTGLYDSIPNVPEEKSRGITIN